MIIQLVVVDGTKLLQVAMAIRLRPGGIDPWRTKDQFGRGTGYARIIIGGLRHGVCIARIPSIECSNSFVVQYSGTIPTAIVILLVLRSAPSFYL